MARTRVIRDGKAAGGSPRGRKTAKKKAVKKRTRKKAATNKKRTVAAKHPSKIKPVAVADAPLNLIWAQAGSLTPNPRNWRTHPAAQMATLSAVLEDPEIGWAGVVLFNERTGRLIDGHARRDHVIQTHGPQTPIPVLVGSWPEDKEKQILKSLDAIAGMAEANNDRLAELLAETQDDGLDELNAELGELLSDLDTVALPPIPPGADEGGSLAMSATPSRSPGPPRYTVTASCETEAEQRLAFDLLTGAGIKAKKTTAT